jgi:hypothetical protein
MVIDTSGKDDLWPVTPNGSKLTGLEPHARLYRTRAASKLRLQVRCSAELGGATQVFQGWSQVFVYLVDASTFTVVD